mgnify:CR=1 FL=1
MTKKIKYIISVIIAIFVVTFGVNATRSLSGSNNSANESETVSYGYFQSLTEAADSALRSLAQKIQLDKFTQQAERLADNAAKYLGTRYRYGSTGPKTFDCSGFIRYVFRQEGINLPRTSRMQYREGEKVSRDQLRPGDLLFFSSPRSGKGRVGHVAMVVDVNEKDNSLTFIHASSSKGVSYQKFPDGGYYSRNYIGAKRVLPDDPTA